MSLNNLQDQILRPFVDETVEALQHMAEIKAWGGDGFEDDVEKFRFKGYGIATKVTGSRLSGVVLLHLYPETALEIGNRVVSRMLGAECNEPKLNEELEGALAEWGNTLIGLATRGLEEANLGVTFTPPFFVTNTEHMAELMDKVVEIVSVPVHTAEAGRFYFNYLLHEKTGDR